MAQSAAHSLLRVLTNSGDIILCIFKYISTQTLK